MNWRSWFNKFWRLETSGKRTPVMVGTRVRCAYGVGVIVNAHVSIDLDETSKLRRRGGPRVNITMPVQRIEVEN